MKKVGGQLWNAMKPTKDGNRRSSSDEKAIQSTHTPDDAPDSKNIDVRPLHKLINEILRHSATSSAQGAPGDQAVLGSLLNSFKSSSCLQELVKTVHKICYQLCCKCSGGGDAKSATAVVLSAVSHYSSEVKMVLVLAAFAVIYGEWWVLAEQTDPLSESIKLLKQLPDKSTLSKIGLLIDAIVKVTNTVVEEKIEVDVQTAVSLTIESVVVCTSQIIGLDDEYTEDDLSKLTENLVQMNTNLASQLTGEGNVTGQTFGEISVQNTPAPTVTPTVTNNNNVDSCCTTQVTTGLDNKYVMSLSTQPQIPIL